MLYQSAKICFLAVGPNTQDGHFTADDMRRIDEAALRSVTAGERSPAQAMASPNK
jgi:hypothetical protein